MKKIFHFLLIILLFTASVSMAQHDLTLHFMKDVNQSNVSNPAFIPDKGRVFIGLPVLSGISMDYTHTGFRYRHIFKYDSLKYSIDHIINNELHAKNYLGFSTTIDLISVKFKVKNLYFGISATEKLNWRFTYPKDLLKLIWYGNGTFAGDSAFADNTASFEGIGLNANHYREYGASAAYKMDKFTFGARVKYLTGFANLWTEKSDISLQTESSEYDLTVRSDIMIRSSFPSDTSGEFDFGSYIMNMNNSGLGADLGVTYQLNDKITLAASVVDLGYIRWKTDVNSFSGEKSEYTFTGVYFNDLANSQKFSLDPFIDTLASIFEIDETKGGEYKTSLTPKTYFSAVYKLTDKDQAGALLYSEYFNGIHPGLTLSYVRQVGKILTASLNYSMYGRKYYNVGAGLAVQLGPMQLYLTQDDILWWMGDRSQGILVDRDDEGKLITAIPINSVNFRFGINLVFGRKPKKDNESQLSDPSAMPK